MRAPAHESACPPVYWGEPEYKEQAMKFEYLVIFAQKAGGRWHPVSQNDKPLLAEEQKKTLYAFANERGAEEWELVDVWRAGAYQQWTFKRFPVKE